MFYPMPQTLAKFASCASTRSRYQVSVYRTIGLHVQSCVRKPAFSIYAKTKGKNSTIIFRNQGKISKHAYLYLFNSEHRDPFSYMHEPCCEKVFGVSDQVRHKPGCTCSHRRWLEAGNIRFWEKRDCSISVVNKGADQIRGYHEADLRLCFRICKIPVSS